MIVHVPQKVVGAVLQQTPMPLLPQPPPAPPVTGKLTKRERERDWWWWGGRGEGLPLLPDSYTL